MIHTYFHSFTLLYARTTTTTKKSCPYKPYKPCNKKNKSILGISRLLDFQRYADNRRTACAKKRINGWRIYS